jgi:dipeptidyl aminopeptidase/acylaminoacyl peptidase
VTFARVWDVENAVALGRPLRLDGHKAIVTISGDGKMVLTATEKIARLWSADSGERVGTPLRHRGLILKAVFSKDGSLVATASEDGTARVWRVSTGEPVGQAMRHESVVSSVAFSADGKRLLTLANKIITADLSEPRTVRVWLTQTGAALCEPIQHDREVTSAELAPDGQHLVTTFGTVARLWDASTGKPVGEPMIHEQPVTFAQFSPDGNRIATVSEKNVQVWDAVRAIAIGRPLVHADRVSKASFVQAGQGLLTVSGGGNTDWSEPPPKPAQVLVWDAPVPEETEVELLAAAAEAVSGYTVTDLGAVVPIHDVAARLASLRTQLGSPAENESAGRSLVRWLLEDPRSRAVSPLAAMHDRVASVTRAGGARAHAPGN